MADFSDEGEIGELAAREHFFEAKYSVADEPCPAVGRPEICFHQRVQ